MSFRSKLNGNSVKEAAKKSTVYGTSPIRVGRLKNPKLQKVLIDVENFESDEYM